MSVRPLKFIVQPVLLEEQDGVVTGERSSEQPLIFYSADALKEWLDEFPAQVERLNSSIVLPDNNGRVL